MSDPVEGRLQRIEDKLDQLHHTMVSVARVEERQATQASETRKLSARVESIEGRVKTLEGRTGWLPGVERVFWIVVAAAAGAASRLIQ